MTEKEPHFYDIHVFCCTNRREAGHPRGCCAEKGSEALRDYMKDSCKKIAGRKIRINSAGCLDHCELGPVMVIYPEGTWYHYDTKEDVDAIIETHIQGGKKLERLALKPDQKRL